MKAFKFYMHAILSHPSVSRNKCTDVGSVCIPGAGPAEGVERREEREADGG